MNELVFKSEKGTSVTGIPDWVKNAIVVSPDELFADFPILQNAVREMIQIKKKKVFKTYLIFDRGSKLYKIGKSQDLIKRFKSIKASCPEAVFIAGCNSNIEKKLHDYFAVKQLTGEWFYLTDSDIRYIEDEFKKAEEYECN